MTNRDVYRRDPDKIALLNNGVAALTDALTADERRTLRFELTHFVCEGQYRSGLVRILESYLGHQGQPEQPAAWISGFFGSGKSHLAKMLRFLWTDFKFPDDGATARGVARLPDDVRDLLAEVSTLGRRSHGLHAAAGTLGSGGGGSVRLTLLGIVFRSAALPASYPLARFCLWLKQNDIYQRVCRAVEAEGREFRRELNDLYVSPRIARALLAADPNFRDERDVRAALRDQFPRPEDITNDEFVDAVQDTLAPDGAMPATAIILDEVQQYVGENSGRSYDVQEVVEACSKRFGDRVLFVGTGQTALSGTSGAASAPGPIRGQRGVVGSGRGDGDSARGAGKTLGSPRRRARDAGRERRGGRPPPDRQPHRPARRGRGGPGGRLSAAARPPSLLGACAARRRSRRHRRSTPHPAPHRLRRHPAHGR